MWMAKKQRLLRQLPRQLPAEDTVTFRRRPAILVGAAVIVIFAVLIIALAATAAKTCPKIGETCPEDWLQLRKKCYFSSSEHESKRNWSDSQEYCRSQGGDLVVIENKQELVFIQQFKNFWIGLHRTNEGFFWVTGAPLNQSLFQVTDPGICVYISSTKIATDACSTSKSFVCSKSLSG
ncbi:C-type lectin domain family 2 member L-like isoform X1 [Ornithorhynchus anatinus]|uniref:C-type lectin domain family 2 member L-like isoform X1 n=1 Tax=Ornithorhynchus anatinus TaxID=9258 RepID=UPI0010A77050|nr:C-type lectin domain family 2 member L-like isoform X1 [Ornithorhynchus anatinus]